MKQKAVQGGVPQGKTMSRRAPQSPGGSAPGPGGPQQFRGGGQVRAPLMGRGYQDGGPVAVPTPMPKSNEMEGTAEVEMMSIPSAHPIASVKTKKKSTMGHNSQEQEVAIAFDTKAMSDGPMPKLSAKAMKALGN